MVCDPAPGRSHRVAAPSLTSPIQRYNWALEQIFGQPGRDLDGPITARELELLIAGKAQVDGEEVRFTLPWDLVQMIRGNA